VVCDLSGFAAATYNRGVSVAFVPTTLLAQVDAAIGGKNGVNLAGGKNLVGTIHQPRAVVCDVEVLASLSPSELVSGMAEVVKYGLIADPGLLAQVERDATRIVSCDLDALTEIVARSAAIKASVVAQDETEQDRRAILNYGHTFAHAFEVTSSYGALRHGEAVALGMMAAAYTANELGRIDESAVDAHRRALDAVNLPVRASFDLTALEHAWTLDKKYRGGTRFVLLNGIGRPETGVTVPRDALARALGRLAR
jgi:3-dehydroquinate synthetase